MADYLEQIKALEDELRKTDYNKRTQGHIGLIKAKIARLKGKDETRRSSAKKGEGYSVRKAGDATVILVGFPSAGKSTLLNALTNANSPVGAYEFTTLDVIPGTLNYRGAQIQVLDVPGIVEGAASGRGRGTEVLSVLHNADLVIVLLDVLRINARDVIHKEVYDSHLRLNKRKPDVKIVKKVRGGVDIGKTVKLDMNDDTIKKILKEFSISNADVVIRSLISPDELIDIVEKNKIYVPSITVLNKIDMVDDDELREIEDKIKPDISISAHNKIHLNELKRLIFRKLNLMRLYCKEVRKRADMEEPLIIKSHSTLKDMCEKLHKDFVTKFKFARIWGKSVKFDGQKVTNLRHVLKDRDVVELHIR